MITSYYLWKWADNDLPGRPNEVFADLLRGRMHPALQPFDARPATERLADLAAHGRRVGDEWDWQVQPADRPGQTHFIFLRAPMIESSMERYARFSRSMRGLDLSGYDEYLGHVIQGMRPKLNCFFWGQYPRERSYDITVDELPAFLRRIDAGQPDPFAVLEDRRNYFVQCYAHQRRFCVEWRENYDAMDWNNCMHWRAAIPKPLESPRQQSPRRQGQENRDALTFANTLQIFSAFLQGKPKPARYHWRDILPLLKREEGRRFKRRAGK